MKNILDKIVEERIKNIEELGIEFGFPVPQKRTRPVHPFIHKKGAILEVKRASPSKGDIAPDLDSYSTAMDYSIAGARAISCLTEKNYFKGTLEDLMKVCSAVDAFEKNSGKEGPAVLRKDFLLNAEEVEVSFRAGADAVLIIARILDKETMLAMVKKTDELGMAALIEVRKDEDLEKLSYVIPKVSTRNIVYGVNSRDLKDFTIDRLIPASMLNKIKKIDSNARVVFESGILSPQSAAFASSMGFSAILLGEAAAKNPKMAKDFTIAFEQTEENANGKFWIDYSEKKSNKKTFVKICGNTNVEDAMFATKCGADFLGFILWKKSPRNVAADQIRKIRNEIAKNFSTLPTFVGVIVDLDSSETQDAKQLVEEGVLDLLQVHTFDSAKAFIQNPELAKIPHYCAVNLTSEQDLEKYEELNKLGEPRILVDAQTPSKIGGTGKTVDEQLLSTINAKYRLWIAGGLNCENVKSITQKFEPELIDLVSSLESAPGKKDLEKVETFFNCL